MFIAFKALMLLVVCQLEHAACENFAAAITNVFEDILLEAKAISFRGHRQTEGQVQFILQHVQKHQDCLQRILTERKMKLEIYNVVIR